MLQQQNIYKQFQAYIENALLVLDFILGFRLTLIHPTKNISIIFFTIMKDKM